MAEKESKKENPYSDDIRPGFLGDKKSERKKKKGGFFDFGSKKERSSAAAGDLADAEEGAISEEGMEQGEGIDGALESEEQAEGFYSGDGGIARRLVKGKQSKIALFKNAGPSAGIFGSIMGIGLFMSSAQSFMPMAIEEMIIEKFNSIGISSTMASDAWLNTQLNLGVRTGGLTSSNNGGSGSYSVGDMDYANKVTVQLGGSDAPLLWVTSRDYGRFNQGGTISDKYYMFAEISRGNANGSLVIIDRTSPSYPGEQINRREVSLGSGSHLNVLHYDYDNNQVWVQTGLGNEENIGSLGRCFNPDTLEEVTCASYGPRGYFRPNGYEGYEGQGRDAVSGVGFHAMTTTACANNQDNCDVAYVSICPATSDCKNAQILELKGFRMHELEDIAFDSDGLVLIFNKHDAGVNQTAYYRISREFMRSKFGIDINPMNGGSTINSDGSTGRSVNGNNSGGSNSSNNSSSNSSSSGLNSSMADLFAFSEFQVEQFESQGIKVVTGINSGGNSITSLLYKKGASRIPVVGSNYINNDGLVDAIKVASGYSNIGTPVTASEALTDSDFKTPYTTASKAWRGGISGWFDNIMESLTETKLSIKRNRWAKSIKADLDDIADKLKVEGEKIKKQALEEDGGVYTSKKASADVDAEVEEVTDVTVLNDGNTVENFSRTLDEGGDVTGMVNEEVPVSKSKIDADDVEVEPDQVKNSVGGSLTAKAIKAAAAAAEAACGVTEALISIYNVVSAYQKLQYLDVITGFLESVDMVKAGDGASSPINEYSNNLTTVGETRDNDNESNSVIAKKTAMQSAGMSWLFSGSNIGSGDQSVLNINFESAMSNSSKLMKRIENKAKFNETCGYIKIASATVDIVMTVVSLIPYVGQAVKAVQVAAKVAKKVAINVAVRLAVQIIVPIVVNRVVKYILQSVATEWLGEDLGNAVVSGASMYLGGNGTSGGQGPGTKTKVAAYMKERDTVIAEEAKYQRAIRSPFDITSQYTFLGSLYYSLIPLAYSGNSFVKSLSSSSSLVSSSLVALSPTASAISENDVVASTGDCPLLGTLDIIGDAFCNPYVITDTSTMGYSPDAVSKIVQDGGVGSGTVAANGNYAGIVNHNLDTSGNVIKGSNLSKYIIYCGERSSQYGIKDGTIYTSIVHDDTWLYKVGTYIPLVEDIVDIGEGTVSGINWGWINGGKCVADETSSDWETEYKYYQRYTENMRLVENMNPGYESNITAFLKDYHKENPIDQSLDGTLARFSGMTKEQVEDTLALMEYYEFIDEYEPGERYAFVERKESEPLLFDNDNKLAQAYYVLLNQISYSDVRNRTFAV